MKKKKVIILSALMLVLAVAGVLAAFLMFDNKEVEPVGNKANIEWYTEDGDEFVISTEEELYGLVKLSQYYDFSGQTIKLDADIVINDGNAKDWAEKAPAKRWYPIDGFAGTFDGQGHSISGVYGYGVDIAMGLFANTKLNCVIKDLKVLNSYFKVDGLKSVGSVVSNGCGTFERLYSDAFITTNGFNAGGLVGKLNDDGTVSATTKTSKMTNCWFDGTVTMTTKTGRYAGGLIGQIYGGSCTISHCLNSGDLSAESKESNGVYLGGIFGGLNYVNFGGSVIMEDTLNAGKLTTKTTSVTGSLAGGTLASTTMNIKDTYVTEESHAEVCNWIGGSSTGIAMPVNTDFVQGEDWYSYTTLNYDEYWTVTKEGTPILKHFAEEVIDTTNLKKAYSFDWYNQYAKESIIYTAEDLYGFAIMSYSNNFSNKIIKLGANITVNAGKASDWANGKKLPEKNWIPIGRSYAAFQGVFDGNGYTISGLCGISSTSFMGLFGYNGDRGELKNVKVVNSYFEACGALGAIAGRCEGSIDTAYSNAYLKEHTALGGGIAGYKLTKDAKCSITNCWYDGVFVVGSEAKYCGGIVGRIINGAIEINSCLFSGQLIFEGEKHSTLSGGFIGEIEYGTISVKDCLNTSEFILTEAEAMLGVGRVFGYVWNSEDVIITIENTYFTDEGYNGTYYYYREGNKQTIKGSAELKRREDILGYDGYRTTSLDFGKYWAVVVGEDGTPILKSFAKKVPSVAGLEKTFDKSWYNPDKNSFTLTDAKDLYGFMYLSNSQIDFKGKTVVLANDILLNTGSAVEWAEGKNIPGNAYNWCGIGKYTNFQGIFNGQGHTISGLYGTTDTSFFGLFSYVGTEGKVKNVRLVNSYLESTVEGSAAIGSIAGRLEGNIDTAYSDAILRSSSALNGGIAGYKLTKDTKSSIVNSWYAGTIYLKGDDAGYTGGIIGRIIFGEMELNSCLFTGKISIGGKTRSANIGGFVGNINETLILKSCLNNGVFEVTEAEKMNSTCRFVGLIENVDTAKLVMENTYATNKGERGTEFYYTSGNKATIEGFAEIKEEEDILGYQGYVATALDFKNYWTVVVNADGTPILKSFASSTPSVAGYEKNFDTSWYDSKKNTYVLTDRQDLYGFAALSNSNINFKGKTITLGKTIVVNDKGTAQEWAEGTVPTYKWNPIGRYTPFAGTFDGKGHTISGICALSEVEFMGLFTRVSSTGTIKNLRLTNSYLQTLDGSGALGSIVGRLDGDMHTVYSDAILTSTTALNGGLVGYKNSTNESRITNSWYAGTMNVSGINSGGIIGKIISGPLVMDNCLFSGTINLDKISDMVVAGGLVGEVPKEHEIRITNSLVSGKFVKLSDNRMVAIGRIVGYITGTSETENVYYVQKDKVTDVRWYDPAPAVHKGTLPRIVAEADLLGEYGYYYTKLDFNKYWTTVLDNPDTADVDESGTPILQSFATVVNSVPAPPSYASVEWYENGKPYVIRNRADLFGLAYLTRTGLTFKGEEIKVADDVDEIVINTTGSPKEWEDGTVQPEYEWEPIGWRTAFQGTFDGNGATISGVYGATDEIFMGLFGWIGSEGEVKNFKLTNSYFESTAAGKESTAIGSVAGRMDGNLHDVYSDATVASNTTLNGGLVGYKNSKNESRITNSWYAGTMKLSGTYSGGIIAKIIGGPLVLDNCLATGTMELYKMVAGQQLIYTGGFVGEVPKGLKLSIANSLVATKFEKKVDDRMVALCRVIGALSGTIEGQNSYCIHRDSNSAEFWWNNGGTIKGEPVTTRNEADIKGNLAYFNTKLDFSATGKWALVTKEVNVADGIPVLKDFVEPGKVPAIPVVPSTVDITWYPGPQTNYEICRSATDNEKNVKELYGFAYLVNHGITTFETSKVTMLNDVTVNTDTVAKWEERGFTNLREWTPIGTSSIEFSGTFNGNNHAIKGIYINSAEQGAGLFRTTATGSSIENLRLEESYIKSTSKYVGSIVGSCGGNINNVSSNAKISGTDYYVGGLAGGITGGSITIENSSFTGEVTSTSFFVGGILGAVNANENDTINIKQCYSAGNVTAKYNGVGGILGYMTTGTVNMENCLNSGKVSTSDGGAGGLLGRKADNKSTINIKYCLNRGEIKGPKWIGSVIGWWQTGTLNPTSVYATKTGDANTAIGNLPNSAPATMLALEEITVSNTLSVNTIKQTLSGLFGTDTVWTIGTSIGSRPELRLE